ncbi:MAG TPA: S4 domain-containing protein [bacterium]|jgi:ribosomal 50S subunit-recycling heat shock protein|nr:S4 domain-containing protein [bacterium]
MRVDKYLQVSGLVKRRVLAQRLCDAGRVRVGDRRAKPSSDVAVGDVLELGVGERRRRVRVLALPASPREAARTTPYEELS